MPTPLASSKKPEITITLKLNGNQYEAVGHSVDRIGDKRGKPIKWRINNPTTDPVDVTIHKFSPGNPCPVDFDECARTVPIKSGDQKLIHAKLNAAAAPGMYTYEIFVLNSRTRHGNPIDPELQIDDLLFFSWLLQYPVALALAAIVVALLAWWFW